MKASISFPEIQNLLTEKIQQSILFSYVNGKTMKVTYPLNVGIFKKDISANLIIKELVGSDLLVQVDAGFGSDAILNALLGLCKNKIPEGLLEKRPESQVLIHLGHIEEVKSVFEKIEVKDIRVLADGLEVEGGLK